MGWSLIPELKRVSSFQQQHEQSGCAWPVLLEEEKKGTKGRLEDEELEEE